MEREFSPEETRSIERNEAVYGDTDMNPNEEDQRDVHHGSDDLDEDDNPASPKK